MTQGEAVTHWQQRARAELEAARILLGNEREDFYGAVLFHCHLALELALKAAYIRQHNEAAPFTHDISELAHAVRKTWGKADKISFEELTKFAILARYGDEEWYEKNATQANAREWCMKTESFLSILQS